MSRDEEQRADLDALLRSIGAMTRAREPIDGTARYNMDSCTSRSLKEVTSVINDSDGFAAAHRLLGTSPLSLRDGLQQFAHLKRALARQHGHLRIADMACGTGHVVSHASADEDTTVYGIDQKHYALWHYTSDPQLVPTHVRHPHAWGCRGPHAHAEQFIVQDITRLPDIPDDAFHLILSTAALSYAPETRALEAFDRVLVPGGIAIVNTVSDYIYRDAMTSRADEIARLQDRGVAIEELTSGYNYIVWRKTGVPLRFPRELTENERAMRFTRTYLPDPRNEDKFTCIGDSWAWHS